MSEIVAEDFIVPLLPEEVAELIRSQTGLANDAPKDWYGEIEAFDPAFCKARGAT